MNGTPETEHSAGSALRWQDKVLVIRVRASGFELPKGHLEPGETAESAALRELVEETSLESVPQCGPRLAQLAYEFVRNDAIVRKRVDYFLAKTDAEPVFGKRPARTRELRWIGRVEVEMLPLVSEDLRDVLRSALS